MLEATLQAVGELPMLSFSVGWLEDGQGKMGCENCHFRGATHTVDGFRV